MGLHMSKTVRVLADGCFLNQAGFRPLGCGGLGGGGLQAQIEGNDPLTIPVVPEMQGPTRH